MYAAFNYAFIGFFLVWGGLVAFTMWNLLRDAMKYVAWKLEQRVK
jgi:hypothetical protein